MNAPLQIQIGVIPEQVPLAVASLQGQIENPERLGAVATHRGLTHTESFARLLTRPQPLKAVQCLESIKFNHIKMVTRC